MKQYKWFLALVYALFLILSTVIGHTQSDENLSLVISSFSSVYIFHTETQELIKQEYSEQFFAIFDPYLDVVSPSGRYRITWESDLNSGLWFTDNILPQDISNFSVDVQGDIDEVRISWLFNDQLAIISAGSLSDSFALTPELEPSQMWLFNITTRALSDWYWDCNTIVHVESSNRLAMLCKLLDFANERGLSQSLLLNFDGNIINQPTDYSVVHTSGGNPLWTFSQDVTSVAFVDDTNILNKKVNIYDTRSQKTVTVDTYDVAENTPIDLRFSPLNSQLAVFKTCQIYSICLDIYGTSNFDLVLASNELSDSYDTDFTVKSIYWTEDENTVFILAGGSDRGGSMLWSLETVNMEVISTWELFSGLEFIIYIQNGG